MHPGGGVDFLSRFMQQKPDLSAGYHVARVQSVPLTFIPVPPVSTVSFN